MRMNPHPSHNTHRPVLISGSRGAEQMKVIGFHWKGHHLSIETPQRNPERIPVR